MKKALTLLLSDAVRSMGKKHSCDLVSFFHQDVNLQVKSPKMRQINVLEYEILINNSSKPNKKFLNSILLWLNDLYITLIKPLQYLIETS